MSNSSLVFVEFSEKSNKETTKSLMASFDINVGVFWDYENVRIAKAMQLNKRAVCSVVQDKLRWAINLTCGNMGFKARVRWRVM